MDYRVTCIRKPQPRSPVEHITWLGGTSPSSWGTPQQEVIRRIQRGQDRFYVQVGPETVFLEVQRSVAGNLYVRTKPDGAYDDNLLALPQCP